MFASSGNFRGLNCPFYAQGNGTCRRSYCHFRHVRVSDTERPTKARRKGSIDDVYPETADVGNCVVPEAQPPAVSKCTTTPTVPTSKPHKEKRKDTSVQYVPTPIAEIALARRRHKMAAKTAKKGTASPTYVPTPLHQITAENEAISQKYKIDDLANEDIDDSGYDPFKATLSVDAKSDKYSLVQDSPVGMDEYDPLVNDTLFISSEEARIVLGGSSQCKKYKDSVQDTSRTKDLEKIQDKLGGDNVKKSISNVKETWPRRNVKKYTSTFKDAPVESVDEDGLYEFNEAKDPSRNTEQYDPLNDDESGSSLAKVKYTPTRKYSVDDVQSKPGSEGEYDPFSNFASKETSSASGLPRRLPYLDAGESSDDGILVIAEDEIGDKKSSSDEEPPRKRQKCSDDDQVENVAEISDGIGSDWLSEITQASFLTDLGFHPPSDNESFTPTYGYNPTDDSDKEKSGLNGLDPSEYLSQLSTQIAVSSNNDKTEKKVKPVTTDSTKKVPAKKVSTEVVKKVSASMQKEKSEKKDNGATKPKSPKSDGKDGKVKETAKSVLGKGDHQNKKKKEPQKDSKVTTDITPVPKVSSDQLCNFFSKMSEKKSQKAKTDTNLQRKKPLTKFQAEESINDGQLKKDDLGAPLKNIKTENDHVDQPKCAKSEASAKPETSNSAVAVKQPQSNSVIVISSSSSSDEKPKKRTLNLKRRSRVGKTSSETSQKAARVTNKSNSAKLLFGEVSDIDSDLQMVKQSVVEISLISDGYSSTDRRNGDKQGEKHQRSEKQGSSLSKIPPAVRTKTSSEDKTLRSDSKSSSNSKTSSETKTTSSLTKDERKSLTKEKFNGRTDKESCRRELRSCKQDEKSKPVVEAKPKNSKSKSEPSTVLNKHTKSPVRAQVVADNVSLVDASSDHEYSALSDDDLDDLDMSFSDSDTFEECLRIFQEGPSSTPLKGPEKLDKFKEPQQPNTEDLVLSTGKQRVAHVSRFDQVRHKKCTPRPMAKPSPRQVCHNRYMQAQQRFREQQQQKEQNSQPPITTNSYDPRNAKSVFSKKRVAHIPASQVRPESGNRLSASSPVVGINTKIQQKYSIGHSAEAASKTLAITAPKGERRVAHLPKKVNPRPIIPPDSASKVPSNTRQRYLNVFIDEFLKTTETEQEAFDKGLEEEQGVFKRATSKNIYLNLSVNTLKRLRTARTPSPSKASALTSKGSISHQAVIGGKPATQHTYTINRSQNRAAAQDDVYEGAFLYKRLKPYLLNEDELVSNKFPRPSDTPGQAIVKTEDTKKSATTDPNQHVCSRCGMSFQRRPDGHYITRDSCSYHWGKFWHNKVGGTIEGRFNCCSGTSEAKGCCIAKYHVTEDKTGNLSGYMKTVSKSPPADGNAGVFALDCEMCYTVKALELTRVTVIDDKLQCVYDTMVKPKAEVVDYNTRFSGITEDDLKNVTTTLQDVQAVLLSMFSSQSILIGHSLESDMLALKLIHSTVVDTAVLFPHRRGPPFKRALRTLMGEYLNRIIQNDVGGHDSREDAKSCMELLIWKAKQDNKRKKSLP